MVFKGEIAVVSELNSLSLGKEKPIIYFTQGDYDNALKAFDLVLERFPANNSKAPDALYWKGKTLMKLGKRAAAATQFHEVVRKYSGSEAAANARLQLKQMGLSSSTSASRKR